MEARLFRSELDRSRALNLINAPLCPCLLQPGRAVGSLAHLPQGGTALLPLLLMTRDGCHRRLLLTHEFLG